jgi:hypothetical protein
MVKPALDASLAFEQSPDDVMEPRPLGMDEPLPMNTLPSFDDFESEPELPAVRPDIPSFDEFEPDDTAPRESLQQRVTDSPSLMSEVLNTFDTLGKYNEEAIVHGQATYGLGKAMREKDSAGIERWMNELYAAQKPTGEQSWYDKTLQVVASIPPSIFTADRLTAAVDSAKMMPVPLTIFNAAFGRLAPASELTMAAMRERSAEAPATMPSARAVSMAA